MSRVSTAKADVEISSRQFTFRGGAATLQASTAQEIILAGPAETGKTIATLARIHSLMIKYPGAQGVIVRKTYQSAVASVVVSYIKKVIVPSSGVTAYGGERPAWFDYANGSRLWVAGMDNASKVLSSERDVIYVNQAEELSLSDWETLTTRATGRSGVMPYGQVMGDANPGAANHWILARARENRLVLLESFHVDNPVLYTDDGALTPQGERTLAVLNGLTGVRRLRLALGKWASAEGAVYEPTEANYVDRFDIPPTWRRIRSIDFGYSNPFVCQWWAIDHDGRMYLYREIYMSHKIVEDLAVDIVRLSRNDGFIETTVADHDAEDRATLERHGVSTIPAHKSISSGIQAVQARIRVTSDGRPRIFFMRDALVNLDQSLIESKRPASTAQELTDYQWPKGVDGKAIREIPIGINDHGMDSMRYAVAYVDIRDQAEVWGNI